MYVIRPIEPKDMHVLFQFAYKARLGITNLPRNEERLRHKVHLSTKAFEEKREHPHTDLYLIVLENTKTKAVGGVAGIFGN